MIAASVAVAFSIAACGGHDAWPVAWNQPGDEALDCAALNSEISRNEDQIIQRLPNKDQTARNVFFYTAGAFLILPWFAMDIREADRVEIQAYFERNAWLRELGARQSCEMQPAKIKMG
jgi:hypothetical protein